MGDRVGLKLDALGLKRSEHIIAVSVSTKADLVHRLGIHEDRITVIYNGVDHGVFRPVLGSRFDFPYILYVGSERPRKNLGMLLESFAILRRESSPIPGLRLVKVGLPGRTDEFRQTTISEIGRLGLNNEVIFAEYVCDKDLAAYYSSALALVMPSLYEGFGLPIVEAMACGCPVLSSNSSSLPEVAGDAALFFDPHDSQQLAQLICGLVAEPSLRHELRRKGFHRVQQFSWERTAYATLQVYREVETRLSLRRKVVAPVVRSIERMKSLDRLGVTHVPQLASEKPPARRAAARPGRISRNRAC
jgi:glycosyltransferase involved in cell wall biosynthesis